MASTYSAKLRFELPRKGEQAGVWDQTANLFMGTLLEAALAGVAPIPLATNNVTLTAQNGAPDQARNAILKLTGSPTATRDVTVPPVSKTYIVWNATTQPHVINTTTGTGVTVPAGAVEWVFCDGANVAAAALPAAAGLTLNGLLATFSVPSRFEAAARFVAAPTADLDPTTERGLVTKSYADSLQPERIKRVVTAPTSQIEVDIPTSWTLARFSAYGVRNTSAGTFGCTMQLSGQSAPETSATSYLATTIGRLGVATSGSASYVQTFYNKMDLLGGGDSAGVAEAGHGEFFFGANGIMATYVGVGYGLTSTDGAQDRLVTRSNRLLTPGRVTKLVFQGEGGPLLAGTVLLTRLD